ncbi:MAG: MurR/RpiR family transcriptional regulator [Coprobacillus sp.]
MSLLDSLKKEELFTLSEREVISYLVRNIEYIPSMTIGEIAEKTFSSNATIIRICHKVGCDGFKDFKYQLTKEIESNKYIQQTVDFTVPFDTCETTHEIMNNISSLYKESVDITHASLDPIEIERIVNTIYESKRMFIYSIGDTNLTVKNFINKLMKINYYPVSATDNHEELATSHNVKKDDCVMFVTYRGESSLFLECMQIIKRTGCKIIVITANEKSVLTKFSDYHILLPYKEKDNRIATFSSQLSFHYVLSVIYALIHNKVEKAEL